MQGTVTTEDEQLKKLQTILVAWEETHTLSVLYLGLCHAYVMTKQEAVSIVCTDVQALKWEKLGAPLEEAIQLYKSQDRERRPHIEVCTVCTRPVCSCTYARISKFFVTRCRVSSTGFSEPLADCRSSRFQDF